MPLPVPAITADTEAFWTCGRDGRLLVTRCDACGFWIHPPGPRCPACLSDRVTPRAVSGHGRVYSFTINRRAWEPGLEVPYVIAVVELDEQPGLRLLTNIVGCPVDSVAIDLPVRIAFEQRGDAFLPVFTRADD
jgi:uncharacterized OB-fold protein